MQDLNYDRCPNDDCKVGVAKIGEHPDSGRAIELNFNGVAAVIAIQSAMTTLSATMKNGHEEDFLEKIALVLYGKVENDPHSLCPLLTILAEVMTLVTRECGVRFSDEGLIHIEPPDVELSGNEQCMYDGDKGDDDGSDEGTMGDDGTGLRGGGNGADGEDGDFTGLYPA